MFNQFAEATAYVTVKNFPVLAGKFKESLLALPYANNYPWYNDLVSAKSVKDIFDLFNIKFRLEGTNFFPIVKNVEALSYKTVLEAIAPYMNDGSIFIQDDFFYYQLWFNAGKIKGSRRKIEDGNPLEAKPVSQPATPPAKSVKKPVNKTSNKSTYNKKPTGKKYAKTDVRTDSRVATITARADNTYTVRELVKELLRQIDNGNADKFVEVKADFLFKNHKYA